MSAVAPSKEEILQLLTDVLSSHFGMARDLIVPDATLMKDLDLDSIDWIDLAVKLEVETGLKLDEQDLGRIRTIRDVVDVVHQRLSADGPSSA